MLQSKHAHTSELAMLTSALMFGYQNLICDFWTTLETLANIPSIAVVIFAAMPQHYSQKVQLFALIKWLS